MIELQRQKYLKAMGVEQYYSRFALPGASPSTILPLSTGASSPAVKPSFKDSSVDLGALTSSLGRDHDTQLPSATKTAKTGAVPGIDDRIDQQVSFSLLVVSTDADLLIVDDLGSADNYEQNLQLIQNILIALGLKTQCHFQHIRWPMQRGALLDNSEATAKEMLQGVLNRHVSQHFLLLGDNAKRFVGDMSWQNGRLHPMIVGTGIVGTGIVGAGEAIVTHSTQEMLSDSALKSAVWTDLQPLKDKLVGP